MLVLTFAIDDPAQVAPFENPPALLPFSPPLTCSDKFCRILICLTDQFSRIPRRTPVTHLKQVLWQTTEQYRGLILPRAQ